MKNNLSSKFKLGYVFQKLFCALLLVGTVAVQVAAQGDIATFYHDGTRINELAFTSNGKFLIAKSGDAVILNNKGLETSPSVQLWELDTKRKGFGITGIKDIPKSCFSVDGNLIAYREKNTMVVMDLSAKKPVSTIKFSENKNTYARPIGFTSENKSLLIEQGNTRMLYNVASGAFEKEFISAGLNYYLSADDNYGIESFPDSFRLNDFKNGKELSTFACGQGGKSEELRTVIFSPENKFCATLSDNKVKLWDLASYKMVQIMTIGAKESIFAFTSDGRYIIGGGDSLKLFELKSKKEIPTPIAFESKITACALSYDNKYIACGDAKGNIKMWIFSDENVASEYYMKEIANEIKLIQPKREFEKTEEFNRRVQKTSRAINNKYLGLYVEKIATEKTLQETVLENIEAGQEAKKARIASSKTQITLKIDMVGPYNADKEQFSITIVGEQENYKKTEIVKVPRRDNAPAFKQNFQTHIVTGFKQLTDDEKGYEIFNVQIKSNSSGKEKVYNFGTQRSSNGE